MPPPIDRPDSTSRRPASMSLVTKIGSLFFMTFIVVLGATGIFWLYLEHTDDDLRVVEDLSQQRILSMQIVALTEDINDVSPDTRRQLAAVSNRFDSRLPRLVERTDDLARVPVDGAVGYPPVTESWERLYSHIEVLIDRDASADARELSRDYVLRHGPQLTETFEEATTAYRDRVEHLRGVMEMIMLGAVTINVVLLVTGTVWTRRRVVTPLRRLEQATKNIRRGDWELRVGFRTADELGALEEAFHEMAAEMEELVTALDEERRFAKSVVTHAPAAVVVHRDDHVVFANPEFCRIFDLDGVDDIPDAKLTHLFRRRDRQKAHEIITELDMSSPDRAARARELALSETDDGEERSVEIISVPLDYGGEPAVLTVMRDISEKKKLTARMMQMDRVIAIGTLVAGVGHEINNPLSFVSGNLEFTLAELAQLDDRLRHGDDISPSEIGDKLDVLRDALNAASEGSQRIADIVDQLRGFSRRDDAPRQPVDIRDAIESAINMASGEIRHRAHLVRNIDDVPAVEANPSQLAQVFLNLLVNAAHAIDEGKAERNTITVSVFSDDTDIIVEISDTGSGIDDEDADRIFDPFYTTKPPGQGTGLGLSICQQIVEAHDGVITFDTEPGQGTTFRVVLPHTDASPVRRKQDQPRRRPSAAHTIAVIDDEPLVAEIFERNLANGHEVVTWRDPSDFLVALDREERYDVVFCDLMMPNLTGRELYETIKRQYPQVLPRLVFITGGAFTPRAREFIRTVEPPLLEKPFDFDEVHELIEAIVDSPGKPANSE